MGNVVVAECVSKPWRYPHGCILYLQQRCRFGWFFACFSGFSR